MHLISHVSSSIKKRQAGRGGAGGGGARVTMALQYRAIIGFLLSVLAAVGTLRTDIKPIYQAKTTMTVFEAENKMHLLLKSTANSRGRRHQIIG